MLLRLLYRSSKCFQEGTTTYYSPTGYSCVPLVFDLYEIRTDSSSVTCIYDQNLIPIGNLIVASFQRRYLKHTLQSRAFELTFHAEKKHKIKMRRLDHFRANINNYSSITKSHRSIFLSFIVRTLSYLTRILSH